MKLRPRQNTLTEAFNQKLTENGDLAFTKTGDDALVNILFFTEYLNKHPEVMRTLNIGTSDREKLFARFVRDPRFGLGRRDLGRILMSITGCSIEEIVKSGRVDDLFSHDRFDPAYSQWREILDWCRKEIENGNELVKKWMPRYSSKNLMLAREIAKYWGMNKQQYGHFIKCDTTEQKLTEKRTDDIKFESVPSQAAIKYSNRFATGEDTKERYAEYIADVKSGKKDLKVATTTPYDICRNMYDLPDPDIFFDKIEKIMLNCIPVVDTSRSMDDDNDSMMKALAIGHYLAKCSTYAKDKVVTFSSMPRLVTLGDPIEYCPRHKPSWMARCIKKLLEFQSDSEYVKEIRSMYTGDISSTDFGAVMNLLGTLDDLPEYIVVLSDMDFDCGSNMSKNEVERLWDANGYTTKIVWWNLNSDEMTAPECDERGNIYMSGYNPMLLKYLEVGFDSSAFVDKLLNEYAKKVG